MKVIEIKEINIRNLFFLMGINGTKNNGNIIPLDKAPMVLKRLNNGKSFLYENSFS